MRLSWRTAKRVRKEFLGESIGPGAKFFIAHEAIKSAAHAGRGPKIRATGIGAEDKHRARVLDDELRARGL